MARKHKCPELEEDNFMTTYADMVTLLMAFFVLLFAMSTVDEAKFIVLLKGLEENFGNSTLQSGVLNGGESILGANLEAGSAIPIPGGSLFLDSTTEIVDDDREDSPDDGTDDEDGEESDGEDSPGVSEDEFLDRSELEELQARLELVLEAEGRRDEVNFRFDERGLVIAVATDDVLFASGSAELQDVEGVLDVIAPEIVDIPNALFVDGHTDDIPFPSLEYTNRNLSADRAIAVSAELERTYGVAADRLIPAGYGEWRPIADNSTEAGRAANRRVELVVAAGGSGSSEQFTEDLAEEAEPPEVVIGDPEDAPDSLVPDEPGDAPAVEPEVVDERPTDGDDVVVPPFPFDDETSSQGVEVPTGPVTEDALPNDGGGS
ncbi:MAG: flagellar motor protein MotB [Actinomycetota bacterium]